MSLSSSSRKRSFALTDVAHPHQHLHLQPSSKRHLSNALAAELEALRISRTPIHRLHPHPNANDTSSPSFSSPSPSAASPELNKSNVFGPTLPSSPFLPSSSTSTSTSTTPSKSFSIPAAANSPFSFSFSFPDQQAPASIPANGEQSAAHTPIATSPPSSTSSSPTSSMSSIYIHRPHAKCTTKRHASGTPSIASSHLNPKRQRTFNSMHSSAHNDISSSVPYRQYPYDDSIVVEEITDSDSNPIPIHVINKDDNDHDNDKRVVVYRRHPNPHPLTQRPTLSSLPFPNKDRSCTSNNNVIYLPAPPLTYNCHNNPQIKSHYDNQNEEERRVALYQPSAPSLYQPHPSYSYPPIRLSLPQPSAPIPLPYHDHHNDIDIDNDNDNDVENQLEISLPLPVTQNDNDNSMDLDLT